MSTVNFSTYLVYQSGNFNQSQVRELTYKRKQNVMRQNDHKQETKSHWWAVGIYYGYLSILNLLLFYVCVSVVCVCVFIEFLWRPGIIMHDVLVISDFI